ncbi:MAG TPA: MFS transporter [Jatrophihabitans sp.]|nr:MFS transporter [Jatrophihabitans sp.]
MTGATKAADRVVDPKLILAVCSGATFIAFLDLSVVNIAFPQILKHFPGTSIDALTWIVSGYAVMFAALLTPGGRIADTLGRTRIFLGALTGFTLASMVCGAAPSVGWLVAGRFVQGGMAAGMIPAALGLILSTTPRERIPAAIGAWSAAAGFSAVVGPAVGGVLLEAFGWRSVFFINGPIGLLLLVAAMALLPRHLPAPGTRLPDPIGTVALALGIAGVVTALTEGDRWGWGSGRTLGLGVLGLVLLVGTWLRSRRHAAPAVDVALWQSARYTTCNAALAVLGVSMFAWMLGGPLFTTAIWHWSTLQTAGALSIGALASMVTSTVAGGIKTPQAQRWTAVLGCLLFAASSGIWASGLFGSHSNFWGGWVPSALLGGSGLGLALTCLSAAAAASVPPLRFAAGIGMTLTARQLGGALGAAMLAAIIASSAVPGSVSSFHHVYGAGAVIALVAAALAAAVAGPKPAVAPAAAPATSAQQQA